MTIRFTQFLRPNGRQVPAEIDLSPEVEALAHSLIANGYRFEMELLRTNHASFECVRVEPNDDGDHDVLAHVICPNGPAVLEAVNSLVREAHQAFTENEG